MMPASLMAGLLGNPMLLTLALEFDYIDLRSES